ncbi:hypothetical protein EYW49_20630 [Siculibacillus lacustris]|uniref:Uncharacterized protein n=1 Tax=Siculibacillus lacustris TaxID=1549641 RepID=A0A4Q9VEW5_9HYPH|nr:hypothetical protein [Siculibacillus lacustris]TBW33368.1 hypothetical protein EYW49_20630 [Siculibacillus lacustris]
MASAVDPIDRASSTIEETTNEAAGTIWDRSPAIVDVAADTILCRRSAHWHMANPHMTASRGGHNENPGHLAAPGFLISFYTVSKT